MFFRTLSGQEVKSQMLYLGVNKDVAFHIIVFGTRSNLIMQSNLIADYMNSCDERFRERSASKLM